MPTVNWLELWRAAGNFFVRCFTADAVAAWDVLIVYVAEGYVEAVIVSVFVVV